MLYVSLKKNEDMCVSNKLADTIFNNRSREFCLEVKNIRNVGSSRPTMIDCESDPIHIATLFSDKYKTLYHSIPYDYDEMGNLRKI